MTVLTKCCEAVLEAKSAPFTGDALCGRFDQKECGRFDQKSVAVLVATQLMWPLWPKQCGRFDQSSVAVLVVIPLSVAVLVVAVLECGRFDWFPSEIPSPYTGGRSDADGGSGSKHDFDNKGDKW